MHQGLLVGVALFALLFVGGAQAVLWSFILFFLDESSSPFAIEGVVLNYACGHTFVIFRGLVLDRLDVLVVPKGLGLLGLLGLGVFGNLGGLFYRFGSDLFSRNFRNLLGNLLGLLVTLGAPVVLSGSIPLLDVPATSAWYMTIEFTLASASSLATSTSSTSSTTLSASLSVAIASLSAVAVTVAVTTWFVVTVAFATCIFIRFLLGIFDFLRYLLLGSRFVLIKERRVTEVNPNMDNVYIIKRCRFSLVCYYRCNTYLALTLKTMTT
jgi:hypothetical protein